MRYWEEHTFAGDFQDLRVALIIISRSFGEQSISTGRIHVEEEALHCVGKVQTVPITVPQQSQYYFDVNNSYNHPLIGCNCTPTSSVSAEVYSNTPSIVAKRLMYFHYGSSRISGGTDVVGEAGPSSHAVYTFAEGYTFGNFSEFLTLQNPNSTVE